MHLVYKFKTHNPQRAIHNGQQIEVQIRSQIQHIWATAVEVVGAFTREALKSSEGSPDWQRLFALMGSIFAEKENRPLVPGVEVGVVDELKQIARRIKTEEFLSSVARHG